MAIALNVHCKNVVEWTPASTSNVCEEPAVRVMALVPARYAVQSSVVATLLHDLTVLTATRLSSGMGIARGRRRQGRRSPFKVFMPYNAGVIHGLEGIGLMRSLICHVDIEVSGASKTSWF